MKAKPIPRHAYGCRPDTPDPRDYVFRSPRPPQAPLPSSVDLRGSCSAVRDQGQLGACTGFSIAVGLREFLEIKNQSKFTALSPLFVYYLERQIEGTIPEDSGAELRDGMKVLAKTGAAPEVDDPYVISKFAKAPIAKATKDATAFRVASYHRLATLADVQACLAGGSGVVLGFTVYESFESASVARTGKLPMPKAREQVLGGHAVFAVGYKTDAKWAGGGYLIVKNSWGTSWGDHGYFYMPWKYITPDLVSDLWTAVL